MNSRSSTSPSGGAEVNLRPFRADDLTAVSTWVDDIDPAVSAVSWLDAVLSEPGQVDDDGRRFRFTFAIIETGHVVGSVLLSIDSWSDGRGEIGFVVGSEWRRRGIATRAIGLVARHAFGEVGLHRLWAACDPENPAAIAALVGNDFAVEGRLVHDRRVGEEWRDSLILGRIAGG